MFVRTTKIHVVVVAQGTVNRLKKCTKKCDARAAEKGAKNVDKRPLYCEFFNELVIEAGEPYTAISKKVVGKSARDNPERDCGWFWGHCSSKKFKRMAREAVEVCLLVLKESNKSRFDSSVGQEQCIDHIPYYLSGLSRKHFFRQPFSK